jgi:ABC-2 type transport system permease protein
VNWDKVWLVFRKDWREIRRNWQVLAPIVVIPVLIAVMLPSIILFLPNLTPSTVISMQSLESILKVLPNNILNEVAGMSAQQALAYLLMVYFLAPLFLVVPIMASSVIASDSFAGEKERRTIEALLATPLSDSELFVGKVLVAFIPAFLVTLVCFGVYTVVVDVLAAGMFNGLLLLPNNMWLLMIFGLAPLVALTSIGLTVAISAKVKGFREAQQISVILLAPILGLVFGQVSGTLFLGSIVLLALIVVFAVVDLLVFYFGVKVFRREEILSKQV